MIRRDSTMSLPGADLASLPGPVLLTTRRLILRELVVEDWKRIYDYESLPQVRRYLLPGQWRPEYVQEHVLGALVAAAQQPRTYYCVALALPGAEPLIGTCSIANVVPGGVASIGWALSPRYWGQGLIPEAARALAGLAFEQVGVSALLARCAAANRASIRVMEKLGMRREQLGMLDQWRVARSYGVWRPIASYYLSRELWEARPEPGAS
jgi:[ribosomal protein S5]-alanine N-acetyltransferase